MRVEIAPWIGNGAIAVDREYPAGTAIGSTIVANHGRESPFCELLCLAIPATPRREGIGVYLAGLNKEAHGNIGKRHALQREALHEAAVLAVEAC